MSYSQKEKKSDDLPADNKCTCGRPTYDCECAAPLNALLRFIEGMLGTDKPTHEDFIRATWWWSGYCSAGDVPRDLREAGKGIIEKLR